MSAKITHDATHQLRALRTGTVTPRELMAETLDRIEDINPGINAIVALRRRDVLLTEAENARPGPLQGMPIAIEDPAETAQILTTCGSPAFRNHVPAVHSPMVTRMRRAAAVINGKTNTPEFGLGSHSYNPVYGFTRNPMSRRVPPGEPVGVRARLWPAAWLPLPTVST